MKLKETHGSGLRYCDSSESTGFDLIDGVSTFEIEGW
jgi:hypothetical protein